MTFLRGITVTAALVCGAVVASQSALAWRTQYDERCENRDGRFSPEAQIDACNKNMQIDRHHAKNLAADYVNRGNAHEDKGNIEQAIADASEAIRLVLRYYFDELGFQKCNVGVYSFNEASIRLHEKLGFTREGVQRRSIFTRGQYYDNILFGITAEEFHARWSA